MKPIYTLLIASLASLAACAPPPAVQAPSPATPPGAPPPAAPSRVSASAYFPPPGNRWQARNPAQLGMDSSRLAAAVTFAQSNEIEWLTDMQAQVERNVASEPYPAVLGPVKDRGGQNGIILRNGYIVAEWGDTRRVDMTFSVAKSYLATLAGLALDEGLIPDLDASVGATVNDGGFSDPHNSAITWRQLLNQTSEWQGTLWDKPDVADRRRGRDRELQAPGTFWEYNDVRVNRLALSLLRLWERPLPEVLRERVMDPIGASDSWVWHGYRNSYVDIGGQQVQSVSGGGHWGGGIWANTRDHARFGYLMLRRGEWNGRQLLSESWITSATTPTSLRPVYGFMWWLNTGRERYPHASESSVFALGAGGNVIWIDPEHEIVAVVRWMDTGSVNEFMRLVTAAVR